MAKYILHQDIPPRTVASNLIKWLGNYWFQITVALLVIQMYKSNNFQVLIRFGDNSQSAANSNQKVKVATGFVPEGGDIKDDLSLQIVNNGSNLLEDKPTVLPGKWKSADFRNLSFVFDPSLAKRKGVEATIVEEKMQACRSYVERFAKTAMDEQRRYGIPASITLSQGLLETDAGGSRLASESNNHFGIKCRTKCRGCTCRNYSDDDIYDMFRVFDSAWESYREHSILLSNDRYKHLKKLGTKNYRQWAEGLKKAGYATDKNYHNKLIRIIEELDLHQFDK
jgi:hypothetical protein